MKHTGRNVDTLTVWTVGHSTRELSELMAMLNANDIQAIADVRRYPCSRRYPHFNHDVLAERLREQKIDYVSFPRLGGRRRPRPDSPNTAWRSASFRGYADYMDTDEFRKALADLLRLARSKRTALLCAEALWWRCHRALISDYLKAHDVQVLHITDLGQVEPHPYTPAAQIIDGRLSYSGDRLPPGRMPHPESGSRET